MDSKGLVALWREGLLAQKVLAGETRGYKNHPQLNRFKRTENPIGAIANYLHPVVTEAERRGYNFNKSKIFRNSYECKLSVTSKQLEYEFAHLLRKFQVRNPKLYLSLNDNKNIETHPLFFEINGEIENWEVTN
jgi:hypothetical protein